MYNIVVNYRQYYSASGFIFQSRLSLLFSCNPCHYLGPHDDVSINTSGRQSKTQSQERNQAYRKKEQKYYFCGSNEIFQARQKTTGQIKDTSTIQYHHEQNKVRGYYNCSFKLRIDSCSRHLWFYSTQCKLSHRHL